MAAEMEKPGGFEFWRKTLQSARLVVAPMVDQSELPWRLLSRRHGAELCYTPMLHASVFVRDERYRREALATCEEDKPLIVQFCANDPEMFLKACLLAQDHCDAVDLNLGCPQMIAKRGHYGAFLQDEWELIAKMVSLCHEKLKVPITCKTRIFEDIGKTVQYAQMLERAGCQLITVHGRTKEQKGPFTGLASWKHIKAVRAAVRIPVYANGNIQYLPDVECCMQETGVEGVMIAEGNLHNPALFQGLQPPVWDLAREYLNLVRQYPCPLNYVRGHLFKLFHHALHVHTEVRDLIGRTKKLDDAASAIDRLESLSQEDVQRYNGNPTSLDCELPFPYWICQPYVRPDEKTRTKKQIARQAIKRSVDIPEGREDENLSRNKMKKLARNPKKSFVSKPWQFQKCPGCGNPKGSKCVWEMCRSCCKGKSRKELEDCPGHKLWFKTKKNKSEAKSSDTGGEENTDGETTIKVETKFPFLNHVEPDPKENGSKSCDSPLQESSDVSTNSSCCQSDSQTDDNLIRNKDLCAKRLSEHGEEQDGNNRNGETEVSNKMAAVESVTL